MAANSRHRVKQRPPAIGVSVFQGRAKGRERIGLGRGVACAFGLGIAERFDGPHGRATCVLFADTCGEVDIDGIAIVAPRATHVSQHCGEPFIVHERAVSQTGHGHVPRLPARFDGASQPVKDDARQGCGIAVHPFRGGERRGLSGKPLAVVLVAGMAGGVIDRFAKDERLLLGWIQGGEFGRRRALDCVAGPGHDPDQARDFRLAFGP